MNAHLWCKSKKLRELKGADREARRPHLRICSEKINFEYFGNFSFEFSRRCGGCLSWTTSHNFRVKFVLSNMVKQTGSNVKIAVSDVTISLAAMQLAESCIAKRASQCLGALFRVRSYLTHQSIL